MYERGLEGTWEIFGDYLSGAYEALLCVVSHSPLSETARAALQNSFAQRGYGAAAGTFLTICGNEPASGLPALTEKELFAAIEGLDPLLLVVADTPSMQLCSAAYRQEILPNQRGRLFGREMRSFASFETMLEDSKNKQAAWALLKSLPKFDA